MLTNFELVCPSWSLLSNTHSVHVLYSQTHPHPRFAIRSHRTSSVVVIVFCLVSNLIIPRLHLQSFQYNPAAVRCSFSRTNPAWGEVSVDTMHFFGYLAFKSSTPRLKRKYHTQPWTWTWPHRRSLNMILSMNVVQLLQLS